MDKRELNKYFDKKQENVDANIFELEEHESKVVRMNIEDFKALARKAGLLNEKDGIPEEAHSTPEENLISSFEVVED